MTKDEFVEKMKKLGQSDESINELLIKPEDIKEDMREQVTDKQIGEFYDFVYENAKKMTQRY